MGTVMGFLGKIMQKCSMKQKKVMLIRGCFVRKKKSKNFHVGNCKTNMVRSKKMKGKRPPLEKLEYFG
jgi:hypothetical protein